MGNAGFMHSPTMTTNNRTMNGQKAMFTRVLIVDDDNDTIDMLKIILAPSDFDVATANSGQEGIDLARKFNPDVMVVDLLMPGMDGLMVCKEVRKFSSVPILVLSAVGKPGIAEQALNEGADDYLIKPMNRNVLVASLNKLARRAHAEKAAIKSNGKS
jgi:two-component system KDP operon response regulator KdpE